MEEELKSVKGPSGIGVGFFKPTNLPENMATTSAEVIASLNEHLVTVLQVCLNESKPCNVGKALYFVNMTLTVLCLFYYKLLYNIG